MSNLKHFCRMIGRTKAPNICKRKIGQRVLPEERLYQIVENFHFWGPRTHPSPPIGVKFRTAKRTQLSFEHAKFHT